MNPTEHQTTALRSRLTTYLTADVFDPERLAEWCQRTYPDVESCREFREQLLCAIQQPGLVTPKNYEGWTGDDDYSTQDQLQAHFKNIWNMCFPHEVVE